MKIITNAKIVSGGKIREGLDVVIDGAKISGVVAKGTVDGQIFDAEGNYLSAGFVDIHVHGGGGSDFMDGAEGYAAACNAHLAHGTTGIVPTTLSAELNSTLAAIESYKKAKADKNIKANLLGLHLEGPYLNAQMAGAMRPEMLKPPEESEYMKIYEAAEGNLIRWTAAPELEGGIELGERMSRLGVTMSIGHSAATAETVKRAHGAGYSLITHLYSACSSIVRVNGFRFAGIVEAAYLLDDMNVEIIADGCHLPDDLLNFVYKFKKTDNVALITDAMRASCQNVTRSYLGTADSAQPVIIEDGVAKLEDRTAFGGSIATMDRCVRVMKNAGVPLADAVKMATETPLSILGSKFKKGKIECGYDADIVIFNDDIQVEKVFVGGEII